jgi:imidazolonepropionase-like amidohydrolase
MKPMNRRLLAVGIVLVFVGGHFSSRGAENRPKPAARGATRASIPRRSSKPSHVLVFRNVRVFDGKAVIPATNVVVKGRRIVAVGGRVDVPAGATVIDGKGRTLLPGLIDSHTHAYSAAHLRQSAVFGVTTELDMAGRPQFARRMRLQQAAGRANDRADLYSAGIPVTVAGGHPTQYPVFKRIPTVSDPRQMKGFVDDRVNEGSDYIKIIYDDARVYGFSKQPTLTRAMAAAAIEMAHAHKRLCVAHIVTREFARQAIEDGIDGLVHMFVDKTADEALIKLAVRKKLFVVPTLTVMESDGGSKGASQLCGDADLSPFLTAANVRLLRETFPRLPKSQVSLKAAMESVRRMHRAGVPILAGSDAPNPGAVHGCSLHRELVNLVAAGLTPVEALQGATSVPAETFSLKNRGRIAAGYRADLLLVSGDPTKHVTDTRKIVGVWKAGHAIDRLSYQKSCARAAVIVAKASRTAAANGIVSTFEEKEITSLFGSGWEISTDQFQGGRSAAKFARVSGGAHNSRGALQIIGRVSTRGRVRWAGAIFYPGKAVMAPADLSAKTAIGLWAKGDGKTYAVVVFTKSGGFQATSKTFVAGKEWKQFRFRLKDLGTDGHDITGVFIGAGDDVGAFQLLIDDVRFE